MMDNTKPNQAMDNTRLSLTGPAGTLEALLTAPDTDGREVRNVAVICHPHPLHGGTMNNKVVHFLARTFNELAIPAIRFNFRGVGASSGEFDEGRGETEDTLAIVDFILERYPQADLWLAGFSFGSYTALRASASVDKLRGLITVAPAVNLLDFRKLQLPECPWLVVQGEHDELVPLEDVVDWTNSITRRPQLIRMKDADHFFHGRLNELRATVKFFLGNNLKSV